MPLIVICGNCCSGKTTFATQLKEYLTKSLSISEGNDDSSKEVTAAVQLINEESIFVKKCDGYKTSADEKITRAALKSAVEGKLRANQFVILDSMNYIKGFRYELFCMARTFRTQYCVVWVEADRNTANEWNKSRQQRDFTASYDERM